MRHVTVDTKRFVTKNGWGQNEASSTFTSNWLLMLVRVVSISPWHLVVILIVVRGETASGVIHWRQTEARGSRVCYRTRYCQTVQCSRYESVLCDLMRQSGQHMTLCWVHHQVGVVELSVVRDEMKWNCCAVGISISSFTSDSGSDDEDLLDKVTEEEEQLVISDTLTEDIAIAGRDVCPHANVIFDGGCFAS